MDYFKREKKIIIALDGYSSCGKSSFAKKIAALLGYVFIDTGAMYRAVTWYLLENRKEITPQSVETELAKINISFKFNPQRQASDIYVNNECVESEIRGIKVSESVSQVSQLRSVREKLVSLQQKMGQDKGIVMDGRDIGTVVFPEAELKIFMTADPKVRAERRYKELLEKGDKITLEQIIDNINARDKDDREREISPLRKANDAIVLDNSNMSQDEQMVWFKGVLTSILDKKFLSKNL
ncbi:MAG: (d)CMP kinase [Rikenellaceae bacterium]